MWGQVRAGSSDDRRRFTAVGTAETARRSRRNCDGIGHRYLFCFSRKPAERRLPTVFPGPAGKGVRSVISDRTAEQNPRPADWRTMSLRFPTPCCAPLCPAPLPYLEPPAVDPAGTVSGSSRGIATRHNSAGQESHASRAACNIRASPSSRRLRPASSATRAAARARPRRALPTRRAPACSEATGAGETRSSTGRDEVGKTDCRGQEGTKGEGPRWRQVTRAPHRLPKTPTVRRFASAAEEAGVADMRTRTGARPRHDTTGGVRGPRWHG